MLKVARLSTIPFTIISTCIAAFYNDSDSAAGATGYLLIVAFDIVLATVVPSLFGCFYAKNPSPRAAFCSVIVGAATRVIMEFALPKDGQLLLPYSHPEFLDYGTAPSDLWPTILNEGVDQWDPATQECQQKRFKDFTGVDSLGAFLLSIITFVSVQFLEHQTGKPLFTLPGLVGYEKNLGHDEDSSEKPIDKTNPVKPDSSDDEKGGEAVVEEVIA